MKWQRDVRVTEAGRLKWWPEGLEGGPAAAGHELLEQRLSTRAFCPQGTMGHVWGVHFPFARTHGVN